MINVVKRVWLPVLVVFAIVIGGLAVSNLRSVFGSHGAIVTPIDADTAENFNPRSSSTKSSEPAPPPPSTTQTSTGSRNAPVR